jgi:hypothetical protein
MGTNARARVTNSAKTSGTTVLLGFCEVRYSLHPESHVPRRRLQVWRRHQERVDTDVSDCLSRLSWRHRARPSATLHEIQARS